LRPGGLARFGQDVVDVHSQGEYVDAGRRVQVIRRDGMSIVVRPLDEPRA
jgi:membrane-bound ClpP family serine protease